VCLLQKGLLTIDTTLDTNCYISIRFYIRKDMSLDTYRHTVKIIYVK